MDAILQAAFADEAALPPAAVVAAAAPVMAAVVAAAQVMAAIVPDETIGCKLDVWKGRATRTKGGMMKQHLKLNRIGTVVSIKASDAAKRNNNLGNFQFPIKP
jgi:Spy/CpxP family protein refolding chaperone